MWLSKAVKKHPTKLVKCQRSTPSFGRCQDWLSDGLPALTEEFSGFPPVCPGEWSGDSSVDIKAWLRARRPGFSSRWGQSCNFFSSPSRPDRLWGPPGLLFSGYRRLFPRVKLTTHPHLVPRLRMCGAMPPLPNTSSLLAWCLVKRSDFTFTVQVNASELRPHPSEPLPSYLLSRFYAACNVIVKVKLSLCFFLTKHHALKAYWGSGSIAPRIIWPRH
jgi:hypothetical protein